MVSVELTSQANRDKKQTASWFVRPAACTEDDQRYLTAMCYLSIFPMRLYPFPVADEKIILRLPQISPWRNGWGRPGDIALLAINTSTKRPVGAIWSRLFSSSSDFVPGFCNGNVPILSLAVEPAARHQGIGGALLQALKYVAHQQGYTELSLCVSAKNSARLLYEQHGFQAQNGQIYPGLIIMSVDLRT